MAQLPPWLNINPSDYLQAAQAGAALGMQIAQAQNRANEMAMAQAAEEAQAMRTAEARRWEFEQNLRQRATELAAQREEAAARLAESQRYHLAALQNQQAGNLARAANYERMAKAAETRASRGNMPSEWNRDPNKEYVTTGGAVVPRIRLLPTEYETITETIPGGSPLEGRPAIPEQKAEKRSLFGIDWLAKDIPAIPAQPAIVPRPEQRITRRVPTTSLPGRLNVLDMRAPPAAALTNAPAQSVLGPPQSISEPASPAGGTVPFKEGALIRSKKTGKTYRVINGEPVEVNE